jgi:hypothetical protein
LRANAANSSHPQFPAWLDLHAHGHWQELVAALDQADNGAGLGPWQAAVVQHLRSDALRSLGQTTEADAALRGAIALDCTPLASLQWLERQWQRQWQRQQSAQEDWVVVSQHLVQAGHGDAVLRSLMAALASLPLAGQRNDLLDQIEDRDALLLATNPTLERQWQWLRRAAPAGGNGFWG